MSTIPDTHLNLPVLVSIPLKSGEASGSGFIFEDAKGRWYLVTAKHVLFERDTVNKTDTLIGPAATLQMLDANPQDTSTHLLALDLRTIQSKNRVLHHPTADVAMILLGTSDSTQLRTLPGAHFLRKGSTAIHTRDRTMLAGYSDVRVGNNVFVYGYPTSIGLRSLPQFDYHRPLLRKGIVAAKCLTTHTIILDCRVYFGNSGGPVVQESPYELGTRYKIIGIVTQWIPFDESRANRKVIPEALYTNSGYAVAESTDRVLELVQEFH